MENLPKLILLCEVLANNPLPGSIELVCRLLEALNEVTQGVPHVQADVVYLQQVLMSAVENAASRVEVHASQFPHCVHSRGSFSGKSKCHTKRNKGGCVGRAFERSIDRSESLLVHSRSSFP